MVMAVTLFLIASLLTEAFDIHGEVVGDMVLQDALEQTGHREEENTTKQILEDANRDLREYFRCGDMAIAIAEEILYLDGKVTGKEESSISVKRFEPEKFLRLLRAVGV